MCTKLRVISCKYNNLPWYDYDLHMAATAKDNAYKLFISSSQYKKKLLWNNFKKYRNRFVQLLRIKKQNYCYSKIDPCTHNSNKLWKTLK